MPGEGRLRFWDCDQHTTRMIRDVKVDVFQGARGDVELYFEMHAVGVVQHGLTGSVGIEGAPLKNVIHTAYTVYFLPSNTQLDGRSEYPMDITIAAIPQHWFDRATELSPGLKDCVYTYFDSGDCAVLGYAISLLKEVAFESPAKTLPSLVDALINSIVTRVLRILCTAVENYPVRKAGIDERQIGEIDAYIDRHIGRAVRASELADLVSMSQSQFSRAFKAATGETPMHYMVARRVDVAKVKLADFSLSLVQIALNCGFASQSHFCTCFKDVTGMTPARYRETLRRSVSSLLCAVMLKATLSVKVLAPMLLLYLT
jgi:AraC-like DNA-binding protein